MTISEISCSKLRSKHIYSSPTNLDSFPSFKTNLLSSHLPSSALITSSSNFPSHSSSFQSNYSQIIVHLKAEWELAEDSEIFDIENTGKASQDEVENVESKVAMKTECPVPFIDDSPQLSSHTAALSFHTPIQTISPPVQAEVGPPGISTSEATASPLVGQDPLSNEGDIILEENSFLEEIEIMRMSSTPPSKQRRRQSASPDSQGRRLLTPTKEDSTPSKKKHTPRKDTPVKKKSRVQCRVRGCRDYLASVRARDRHENQYCRFREGAGSGLSSDTFPVSSHAELHIDNTSVPCLPESIWK